METTISVVIPHYGAMESLYLLIGTIPDRMDIQILIVDDNTYDNNEEFIKLIEVLGRRNVECYFNSHERGAGACRNEAIKHIKGKWTVFADSDDWFVKGAFDRIFEHIDDEADVVFFKPTSVNMPDKESGSRHIPYEKMLMRYLDNPSEKKEVELKYGFIVPWSKMIRSSVFLDNDIRFDEVRWSNDVMFSIKCANLAKRIAGVNQVIYCVTRDSGSLTTQRNPEEFRIRFEVYIRKYLYLRENESSQNAKLLLNAPIGKIVKAVGNGYGIKMVLYIIQRYREENIPILSIGCNTFRNFISDNRKSGKDRKYISR